MNHPLGVIDYLEDPESSDLDALASLQGFRDYLHDGLDNLPALLRVLVAIACIAVSNFTGSIEKVLELPDDVFESES